MKGNVIASLLCSHVDRALHAHVCSHTMLACASPGSACHCHIPNVHGVVCVSGMNGQAITSLLSLVELVTQCEDEYMEFKFADDSVIVIETHTARNRDTDILEQHNIPENMSKDVKAQIQELRQGAGGSSEGDEAPG